MTIIVTIKVGIAREIAFFFIKPPTYSSMTTWNDTSTEILASIPGSHISSSQNPR